jgi:hypothetical protein
MPSRIYPVYLSKSQSIVYVDAGKIGVHKHSEESIVAQATQRAVYQMRLLPVGRRLSQFDCKMEPCLSASCTSDLVKAFSWNIGCALTSIYLTRDLRPRSLAKVPSEEL